MATDPQAELAAAREREDQARRWFEAAEQAVFDARETRERNRAILRAATKRRERLEEREHGSG